MILRAIGLVGHSIDIDDCKYYHEFQDRTTGDTWSATIDKRSLCAGDTFLFMFGAHPRWYTLEEIGDSYIAVVPLEMEIGVGVVDMKNGAPLPKPTSIGIQLPTLEELFPDDDDEPGAEQWDIHVTNTDQLYMYPLGTKFYVRNGAWNGIVTGNHEERMIYVAETGVTHQLLRGEPTDLHISLDPDTCT